MTCDNYEVKGYPTLLYFRYGLVINYSENFIPLNIFQKWRTFRNLYWVKDSGLTQGISQDNEAQTDCGKPSKTIQKDTEEGWCQVRKEEDIEARALKRRGK